MKKTVSFLILFSYCSILYPQKVLTGYSNIGPVNIKKSRIKIDNREKPQIIILSDYTTPSKDSQYKLEIKSVNAEQVLVNGKVAETYGTGLWKTVLDLNYIDNKVLIVANSRNWLSSDTTIIINKTKPYKREQGLDLALLFAVNDYSGTGLANLENPISEAVKLKEELENDFGFIAELDSNPDLDHIKNKIYEYAEKFKNETDLNRQLLIFLTGHGFKIENTGFFVPKNAVLDKCFRTCYQYNEMREDLKKIRVRHLLLVVDACYSAFVDPRYLPSKGDILDSLFVNPISITDQELYSHKNYNSFEYLTSVDDDKSSPDNSQLIMKLFDAFNNCPVKYGMLKSTDLLPFIYLAKPRPKYGYIGNNPKTTFIFFKK